MANKGMKGVLNLRKIKTETTPLRRAKMQNGGRTESGRSPTVALSQVVMGVTWYHLPWTTVCSCLRVQQSIRRTDTHVHKNRLA